MLLVLLGFAWLIRTAVHKDLGLIRPTPLNAPIGIYIAVCLFATLAGFIAGNVRGITGFFYVLKYVEYFIVYFLVSNNLENRDQLRRFLITMLATSFIVELSRNKAETALKWRKYTGLQETLRKSTYQFVFLILTTGNFLITRQL